MNSAAGSDAPTRPPVTILVVDDNDLVRRLTKRIFHNAGFVVIEAPGGGEALEMLQRNDCVDVIVCDLMMPTMSGRDFALRLSPEQRRRIVFVTGYFAGAKALVAELGTSVVVVQKPYTAEQIVGAVHAKLAALGATAD